jgi:hypothetical protein
LLAILILLLLQTGIDFTSLFEKSSIDILHVLFCKISRLLLLPNFLLQNPKALAFCLSFFQKFQSISTSPYIAKQA